ncbi:MAG: NUDIX domain-containing protein [Anaerolineae bacterium]|nr:NUDIX domain-containing protein [Anaerolineae bacterium]
MSVHRFYAAGGVVIDGARVLALRSARYADLRLPKGHIEGGEDPLQAALREVTEESGYADLEVLADLGVQVVEYDSDQGHTIRHEHYYLMRLRSPRQRTRPPGDVKFTPEWLSWPAAIEGLVFDEERRWLIVARALLAPDDAGAQEEGT